LSAPAGGHRQLRNVNVIGLIVASVYLAEVASVERCLGQEFSSILRKTHALSKISHSRTIFKSQKSQFFFLNISVSMKMFYVVIMTVYYVCRMRPDFVFSVKANM